MPESDRFDLLRRLRAVTLHLCVLLLTPGGCLEDRVAGITAGGDDYLTKPFSHEELLTRLRELVRRAGNRAGASLILGELTMDDDAREVHRDGTAIGLTATEFELLRYLMCHPRQVLSQAQIVDWVWSYDFSRHAHVVELYISYLREKIDAGRDPMIHTAPSVAGEVALELSAKEFAVLELLLRRVGEVLSRSVILEHVWDFAYAGDGNVVDQYVAFLRRKIDRPFGVEQWETVRGAGYRLCAEPLPAALADDGRDGIAGAG